MRYVYSLIIPYKLGNNTFCMPLPIQNKCKILKTSWNLEGNKQI